MDIFPIVVGTVLFVCIVLLCVLSSWGTRSRVREFKRHVRAGNWEMAAIILREANDIDCYNDMVGNPFALTHWFSKKDLAALEAANPRPPR